MEFGRFRWCSSIEQGITRNLCLDEERDQSAVGGCGWVASAGIAIRMPWLCLWFTKETGSGSRRSQSPLSFRPSCLVSAAPDRVASMRWPSTTTRRLRSIIRARSCKGEASFKLATAWPPWYKKLRCHSRCPPGSGSQLPTKVHSEAG